MDRKQRFLQIAGELEPTLFRSTVYPRHEVEILGEPAAFQGWSALNSAEFSEITQRELGKNDSFVVDFGDHHVGYVSFSVVTTGHHFDAPLSLRLVFGEMPCEVAEPFDNYDGWLSKSWLQQEILVVDEMPATIKLPRRYSFRYLSVQVIDTSQNYKVRFTDFNCETVTSGDIANIKTLPEHVDTELRNIDQVGIKTLQDCMQTVFEDGPKRDRRLWIGDLRLQALANYYTFNNDELVKKCLYLFGGLTDEQGQVVSTVFERPVFAGDHILFVDYSLLFVSTLADYFCATADRQTLADLWPTARDQIRIALSKLDERSIIRDDSTVLSFIDWNSDLNKQAALQGVLLYCMKDGQNLARIVKDEQEERFLEEKIKELSQAAIAHLWDEEKQMFISGRDKQISWASQVWMVLAEVFDVEKNSALLKRLVANPPSISMTTPYMYHHLIEALFLNGMKDMALHFMRDLWGRMMNKGADCFWEAYIPEDELFSPYGSHLINSYCHAWSCTPTYFIRKYIV